MEKKDERPAGNKNSIPAGTFAASDRPPPQRRSDPGESLADGVARPSQPGPPEGEGAEGSAIDRRRYTSTLMGVAPPNSDAAPPPPPPPPVAPVLAPPKWRGAKAYLEGQEPKPRISAALPTPAQLAAAEAASGASATAPSRVTTKLGPVAPPAPPPSSAAGTPPAANPDAAIDQAIERMLEGQTAVPMEVEVQEPEDLDQLEELPIEEVQDEPSERAVPLARLALKQTGATAGPAPVPPPPTPAAEAASSGFAWQAPGDERAQAASGQPVPNAAAPPPPPPPPPAERAHAAGTAARPAPREPAPPAAESAAERAPRVAGERAGARQAATRPARPVPVESALRELRPGPQWIGGVALLAAMVLIGAGGWAITAGGFRRSIPPASALLPVQAAPVTEPLPAAVPPTAQDPAAPAPGTEPAKPTASASESTAVKSPRSLPTTRSSEPSSTRASAQRDQQARAQTTGPAASDEPPVLRVTPQGNAQTQAQASETPTRREVLDALEPLRPAVERCANGQRGIAQLDITVINTGVVTHAIVGGDFAGTPEGSCMALAARGAKFAPFQKPRFRVIFPYSL